MLRCGFLFLFLISFVIPRVIFYDDFSGSVGNNLGGTTPDHSDGTTWTSSANWKANGTNTTAGDATAYLPFSPQSGNLYSLSSTITTAAGATTDWTAFGFAGGNATGVAFWTNAASNSNWSILRDDGEFVASTGAGSPSIFLTSGAPASIKITLDTTTTLWSYSFSYNGILFTSGTFAANPAFTHVGFGKINAVNSTIDNFLFETTENTPTSLNVTNYLTLSSTLDTFLIDGTRSGNGANRFSQITSSGAVNLNGGTLVISSRFSGNSGFTPAYGTPFTLISGSQINGTYNTIDNSGAPTGVRYVASYENQNLNVYATPENYESLSGLKNSQKSVARAIQSFRMGSIDLRSTHTLSNQERLYAALVPLSEAQLGQAIQDLNPDRFQAMDFTQQAFTNWKSITLSNQFTQIRSHESHGFSNHLGEYDYEPIASLDNEIFIPTRKTKSPWKLFGVMGGGTSDWTSSGDSGRSEYVSGNVLAGATLRLSNELYVGVYGAFHKGEGYLGNQESPSTFNGGAFGLTASISRNGFYWNGDIAGGTTAYENSRSIRFLNEIAKSSPTTYTLTGANEIGYSFKTKYFSFGPFVSGEYNHSWNEAFQEEGSVAALHLKARENDQITTRAGAQISYVIPSGKNYWIPFMKGSWKNNWLESSSFQARFQSTGTSFEVTPEKQSTDTFELNAGTRYLIAEKWDLSISYLTELLNSQLNSHYGQLSIGYQF